MSLDEYDQCRLFELKDRFRQIANNRWNMNLGQRVAMLDRASFDLALFAHGLLYRHGAEAMPAVRDVLNFLTDKDGAPKLVEIALRPRPAEERLSFVPAEAVKRGCRERAGDIVMGRFLDFDPG